MTFDRFKPVNSIFTDTAVTVGNLKVGETKTLHGLLGVYGFNDYYKLTLESQGILEVRLACPYPSVDFQVLDKNRVFVAGSCEGGVSKESLSKEIDAGDFYIWIYCIAGTASNYSLSLSFSQTRSRSITTSSKRVIYKLKELEFSEMGI